MSPDQNPIKNPREPDTFTRDGWHVPWMAVIAGLVVWLGLLGVVWLAWRL